MINIFNIVLNDLQTKKFAAAIYPGIADYIKAHQQEYEEFLKNEMTLENKEGEI